MTGSLASIGAAGATRPGGLSALNPPASARPSGDAELEKTFQQTVAGMFFGQLVKSLRSTVGEPAYIHGGQAEEMFQAQFDQIVSEDLAENKGSPFVGDLYRQFRIQLGMTPEAAGGLRGAELTDRGPAETAVMRQDSAASLSDEPFVAEKSAIAAGLLQAQQVAQASQQGRSPSQGVPATTAASAFSGLFRK